MEYDDILDRLWGFDAEVFAHDCLFVFHRYRDGKEYVFHNCVPQEIYEFIYEENPILMGYNCKSYDKYILLAWLNGYSPEEIKQVNDAIVKDKINGWELKIPYMELPPMIDLLLEINPPKSVKELEGQLGLDITETTIPFDLPTAWTKEQYEEVLYYCRHDVDALFPIFDTLERQRATFKSKFIVAQICKLDPIKAVTMTNANLTAWALGATKQEYNDTYLYEFPDVIDKSKIPQEFLDYIQMCREHNDDEAYIKAHPMKPLNIDGLEIQVQLGGIHGFPKSGPFQYNRGKEFDCD